jgi:DNA-directed RNA polymerase subunit E'/Rpb7
MTSPYADKILYRVVPLHPNQMGTEIYNNLKENLRESISGKCVADGYISKIYEIKNYQNGEFITENFSADAMYDVTYSARICCPIIGSTILCKISQLNKALLEARNGPIKAIIETIKHSPVKFFINANGDLCYKENEKSKGRVVKKGDIAKIKVIGKQYNIGDEYIIILGKIEDLADEREEQEFDEELKEKKEDKFINPNIVNVDLEKNK